MNNFYKLDRVVYSTDVPPPTEFYQWSSCIRHYGKDVADEIRTYSKTEAVGKLYHMIRSGNYSPQGMTQSLLAILTDRGLLFPQSRERFYTSPKRSMRRSASRCSLVHRQFDSRKSQTNRILAYSERVHSHRKEIFDEEYPFISLEHVQKAIRLLFADWEGPFSSLHLISDDVGYCKGDLGKFSYSKHPQRAEDIMSEWLRTVKLKFGSSDPIPAWDLLAGSVSFTVPEYFEFFSYILPKCIWLERLHNSALDLSSAYKPSLAKSQKEEFIRQIKAFKRADLSLWKSALPALKQVLYPDLKRFQQELCLGYRAVVVGSNLSRCISRLNTAFSEYLSCAESSAKSSEDIEILTAELASYFLESYYGKLYTPLFLDNPYIIFQLFRSPVLRYVYQFEDRNWNTNRIIYDICTRPTLPITMMSLPADRKLFLSIVDVCANACTVKQVPFSKEPWEALWVCIEQSVQCLSFQMEDLFSVQHPMYDLLHFRSTGYPVFDAWLKQKLSKDHTPVYIAHWRSLTYKLCNPSHKQTNKLENAISKYRSLFESPVTDEEDVLHCLESLAAMISQHQITAAPTEEEISSIAGTKGITIAMQKINPDSLAATGPVMHLRARNGPFAIMKSGSMSPGSSIRGIDMIHTEWLLLQCVCSQVQRELMESIYLLLTRTGKGPA